MPAPGSGVAAEHVSDEDFVTIVNGGVNEVTMSALFGLEHPHSEASEKLRTRVAELEVRVIRGVASAEEKASLERLSAELPTTGSSGLLRRKRQQSRRDAWLSVQLHVIAYALDCQGGEHGAALEMQRVLCRSPHASVFLTLLRMVGSDDATLFIRPACIAAIQAH